MIDNNLPYWLAALYLPNIGSRTFTRWLSHFATIQDLFSASSEKLISLGMSEEQIKAIKNPNWKAVELDLAWASHDDHHILSIQDEDYPALLKEIYHPPFILYIRGHRAALKRSQLAMVGSRNATQMGLENAKQFAYHLAEAGFAITSGLALGIDGASHRGALAANGVTIAVFGTGLNHVYPSSHRSLADDILRGEGAWVSEFPLALPAHAMNFPRRNRIISGLSAGVLVVEAALKSGSLITAKYALEQGREVFALPGSIHQSQAKGCHHLIKQGAKLVESVEDMLGEIGSILACYPANNNATKAKEPRKPSSSLINLSPEQQQILEKIAYEPTSIDVILLRSGLTAGELSSILLTLELYGYIQSVPGGFTRIIVNQ